MMKCQLNKFSLDENIHYLNCAYMAPILNSAEKASLSAIKKIRNPHHFKPKDFFEITNKVRKEFSKIINSKPDEIAILPSTSYGFSSVFKNIPSISNKTNAITIEDEFPSGYFGIKKWSETNKKELIVVKRDKLSAKDWNQKIIENINEKTSVVLTSSIHWMNGTQLDLKEIGNKCRKVGAYFVVDGTQSVGAMPIDVKALKINALICASYKWLFGPYSMALGYFSEKFNNGIPIEESWMNRSNAEQFSELTNYESKYRPNAGRYNVGQTSNFILSPIMLEGLKQINEWGVKNIFNYCRELSLKTIELCKELPIKFEDPDYFSPHLFSLGLAKEINPKTLKEKLEKNNIYVSLRGENLRVSINVFNDLNDIKKLVEQLQ